MTTHQIAETVKPKKKWNWIDQFVTPLFASFIAIFGKVNSGKTGMSFYLIERFLERNKKGQVIILSTKQLEELLNEAVVPEYRANFHVIQDLENELLFTPPTIPKFLPIDEAIIFMNNKKWGSDISMFLEQFSVIFRHKALRLTYNAQTDKVLGSILQMSNARIYKRCTSNFLDSCEANGSKYVKQYRDRIMELKQNEYLYDDGRKRTKFPIKGRNPLPSKLINWSDELSKSFSKTTLEEFKTLVFADQQADNLELDEISNIVTVCMHLEHQFADSFPRGFSQDKMIGIVQVITMKNYNKATLRVHKGRIEALLNKHGCPYCSDGARDEWEKMGFKDYYDQVYQCVTL